MRGVTQVALGAFLLALGLLIVAVLVWQEARRGRWREPPTYALDDATRFVWERLDDDAKARLDRETVLRILEWEVFDAQMRARDAARRGEPAVVVLGGAEDEVERIVESIGRGGLHLEPDDVRTVLALEARYLVALGLVGPPAEGTGADATSAARAEGDPPGDGPLTIGTEGAR